MTIIMHYMFYPIESVISKKQSLQFGRSFRIKNSAILNYHTLNSNTNTVFILRKIEVNSIKIPRPLLTRFARISAITESVSEQLLTSMVANLVNNYSYNTLYFFIKKLFWLVPVPKHKQLLYVLRALIKFCFRSAPHLQGLSIILRGKLAATGNKRKSVFPILVGKGLSSRITTTQQNDFRLFRTPVGVIGVTSILTYTH